MLTVHRAERADDLVAALADVLAEPVGDPFTPEVVAVPSRGIERWLAQRLSNVLGAAPGRADGVCANVEFPFPGRLVGTALRAVTGIDPDTDPWAPARAVWPLLAVIDEHLDEAWMATLSAHLGGPDAAADDPRRARRFGAARHLADLFDRYGVHRPAMIERWAAGDDVDGRGAALPADLAWQATLWRLLRERLGVPSPAERLGAGVRPAARRAARSSTCPAASSLYGLTRLAPTDLQVLDAVGDGPRRPPVPAPPVARAVGPRARRTGCGRRAARCSRRGARTPARCSSPLAAHTSALTPTRTTPATLRPTRCCAACRPTSAPTTAARPARCPARRTSGSSLRARRRQRRRCTRATAGPARSRCCATRSSTCSPTTRRSSRATSS